MNSTRIQDLEIRFSDLEKVYSALGVNSGSFDVFKELYRLKDELRKVKREQKKERMSANRPRHPIELIEGSYVGCHFSDRRHYHVEAGGIVCLMCFKWYASMEEGILIPLCTPCLITIFNDKKLDRAYGKYKRGYVCSFSKILRECANWKAKEGQESLTRVT